MNGSQDGAIDASTMMASTQAVLDDNHDSAESNYSSDRIPSSSSHPRHDFEKLNEINQRKRPRAENDDSKQPTASAHRIRRVGKAPLLEPTEPKAPPRRSVFISKQDIQWNLMYDKLTAFQQNFQNTMVPQCFDGDPCLGRWVHYQRGKMGSKEKRRVPGTNDCILSHIWSHSVSRSGILVIPVHRQGQNHPRPYQPSRTARI